MNADWTPTDRDPARRLFQVRRALGEMPFLSRNDRAGMEEFASNLERKYNQPVPLARKEN